MRTVIIGDSILSQLKLKNGHNLAVSGARTSEVLHHQVPKLYALNPELVIVCCGTNDINEHNNLIYRDYVELLQAIGRYPTWICTIPECEWKGKVVGDGRNITRVNFNDFVRGFSQEKIELPSIGGITDDGVHFNNEGMHLVKRIIVDKINSWQFRNFYIKDNIPQSYAVGAYSYGSPKIIDWRDGTTITIGKYCSVATDVTILLSGEHDYNSLSTYPFACNPDFCESGHDVFDIESGIARYIKSKGNVAIGNDVWIGWGATILSGVTIGDGAVIGARSLVIKDIPPYSIVGGVPAKVIRKRFSDDIIAKLLELKWWDMPDDVIKANYPLLSVIPTDETINRIRDLQQSSPT